MNKFATFAVLALAAVALAHCAAIDGEDEFADERDTQAALNTSDDVETQAVRDNEAMSGFADYCIQSRDYVFTDIKSRAGSASSLAFSWVFSMSEDITKEALNANKYATTKLGDQLAHPESPVEGTGVVAEAQQQIANQNQPLAFVTAVRGALAATAQAVVNVASQKIASVKEMADPAYAVMFLSSACEQVEQYEKAMREQFESYKSEMPEGAQKQYANTKFDDVPCVTSHRISRVNGVCRFVSVSFDPIKKALGI